MSKNPYAAHNIFPMCQNHKPEYVQNLEHDARKMFSADKSHRFRKRKDVAVSRQPLGSRNQAEGLYGDALTHARNKQTHTHTLFQSSVCALPWHARLHINPATCAPAETRAQHLIKHVTHTQLAYNTCLILWASSKLPIHSKTNTQTAKKKFHHPKPICGLKLDEGSGFRKMGLKCL